MGCVYVAALIVGEDGGKEFVAGREGENWWGMNCLCLRIWAKALQSKEPLTSLNTLRTTG